MDVMIKVLLLLVALESCFAKAKFDHNNCMEMKPEITHGRLKKNSFLLAHAKLYSIHISSSSFKAGIPIKIVIKSCKDPNGINHGMQAFLLQARTMDTKFLPIGNFDTSRVPHGAQAISCHYPYDSIVSRSDSKVKNLSVVWNPPIDYSGRIAFYFTVVPHKNSHYYLRAKSPLIHAGNGTSVALEQKCYSSDGNRIIQSSFAISLIFFAIFLAY